MRFVGIWATLKVGGTSSEDLGMAGRRACVQRGTGHSGLGLEASKRLGGRERPGGGRMGQGILRIEMRAWGGERDGGSDSSSPWWPATSRGPRSAPTHGAVSGATTCHPASPHTVCILKVELRQFSHRSDVRYDTKVLGLSN